MKRSEWQALERLLRDNRENLMPEPPESCKFCRKGSDNYINAYSAWQNECEDIDELLDKFYAWNRED